MTRTLYLFIIIPLLLSGCIPTQEEIKEIESDLKDTKQEISKLKSTLGDYQFHAMDPQLSFSIKDVEFQAGSDRYDSPKVKFRADIKQNNYEFPLKNYDLAIWFIVSNGNNDSVSEFYIQTSIENGIASLSDEENLYRLKNKLSLEGYKLKVKYYNWYPRKELMPFIPAPTTK